MKIEHAIDFQDVSAQLRNDLRNIPYNKDLRRLYQNIESMVTQLSKLEVEARRMTKSYACETKVSEINKAIDHLEKLILMAKLMS